MCRCQKTTECSKIRQTRNIVSVRKRRKVTTPNKTTIYNGVETTDQCKQVLRKKLLFIVKQNIH